VLEAGLAELVEGHGCHTVILYGSYARGDATEASDYDLAGLWGQDGTLRVAHTRHGGYLDAFIYPEAVVEAPVDDLLKLHGGRVLVQRDGLGDRLLARVAERFAQGPEPWPADDRAAVKAWIGKMLPRIARGDAEGHYRRAMLLYQLLDYFRAQNRWYLGPKASFAALSAEDPTAYRAFEAALAPGADLDAVAALATLVQERL
jgi:hypothetical protein